VRGEVYGPECLERILGPDALPPAVAGSRRPVPYRVLTGIGFLTAAVASVLPWSRFNFGAGAFGGWGLSPLRWSLVAALAAAAGSLWWVVQWWLRRRPRDPGRPAITLVLAGLVAAGSVLDLLRPPPYTDPWLGPWVALSGAVLAGLGGLLEVGRGRPESLA
jgi:hypothetical protein